VSADDFQSQAERAELERRIKRRLRAFRFDRHPFHVLEAWRECRRARLQPSAALLSALDAALELVEPRRRRGSRQPACTLRDMEILESIEEAVGVSLGACKTLPAGTAKFICPRFRMSEGSMKQAFARLRARMREART
jgi:hypothetical protein